MISKKQALDSGLALVLISLIVFFITKNIYAIYFATGFTVVCMTVPIVFKPFAKLWFGMSHFIGTFLSKIILSIVFYTIIFPVGFFRQMLGKDSLMLKKFKKGNDSVFVERDHIYKSEDILKPY